MPWFRNVQMKIANCRRKIKVNGINCIRVVVSLFYFLCGIILVYFSTSKFGKLVAFFSSNKLVIFWCIGWSAIGIAAGLWNSRNDNAPIARRKEHYFMYFLFVLFIASLAAVVAFLSATKSNLAYTFSALVAMVVGFAGDKLAGDILKLKN